MEVRLRYKGRIPEAAPSDVLMEFPGFSLEYFWVFAPYIVRLR